LMGDTVGEQQITKLSNLNLYLLNIDIISYYVVARGGIEPPTHGFSVRLSLYTQTTVVCYQLLLSIVLSIYYIVNSTANCYQV
jgi:hypothetical protein